MRSILIAGLVGSLALTANAQTAPVVVNSDITTSTVWTANNVYDLQVRIFVLPGATLTIEAGTVIASTAFVGGGLTVTRGAQIIAKGTTSNPIIFTSTNDVLTWDVDPTHPTGGDPHTGVWRPSAREWAGLAILGAAYICENETPGNTQCPDGNNVAIMEGLIHDLNNPTITQYGGDNDRDDSGCLEYVCLRYGGRVIALNNELNGLSLGGIGCETDLCGISIMNNVDDGIEIWGGTVNLRRFEIWNVGDDGLDIDQGYRGKVQEGLIVQGFSLPTASQGMGVGDNAIETDGAENSDWLPVTTTTMYNLTVIGEPNRGDGLTAWRDGARVQYRNCIFMDGGERVVRFDNVDGDGAVGYGHNGTLGFLDVWATPYNMDTNPNNCTIPADLKNDAQIDGNLAEIKDCVLFNNNSSDAYTNTNGFNDVGANNPACNNVIQPVLSPITAITRDAVDPQARMARVTFLDPRPANDAVAAVAAAREDDFFTGYRHRGAFGLQLWTGKWATSVAYGFIPYQGWTNEGGASAGGNPAGAPDLGITVGATTTTVDIRNGSLLTLLNMNFQGLPKLPLLGTEILPILTSATSPPNFQFSFPNIGPLPLAAQVISFDSVHLAVSDVLEFH